jgi:hypothetical protein
MKSIPLKNRLRLRYDVVILAAVIAFTAYVRIRLCSVPLERDEGEYAYMGQLLLQGVMPFREAFNMKLPGTGLVYALFMLLFGQSDSAIRIGLALAAAASALLVYKISRHLFGRPAAAASGAFFALASLSPGLFGYAAHATHFVVLFSLAGIWLIVKALEKSRVRLLWISGACFGCAFLMKQPGIFFLFFAFLVLGRHMHEKKRLREDFLRLCGALVAGFSIPLALAVVMIVLGGDFGAFRFWVFQYARAYGGIVSLPDGMANFRVAIGRIWDFMPLFCVCTAAGIVAACGRRFSAYRTGFLLFFFLFSFLAVMPGLFFRVHYFILLLPAAGLLLGGLFHYLNSLLRSRGWLKYAPAILILGMIGENVYSYRAFYFSFSSADVIRRFQPCNYFNEAKAISGYIAAHTQPDERIAVVGSEPQIYFYSKRRAATGFVYVYSLMEKQPYARAMQKEFIADLERVRPGYIVFAKIYFSWLVSASSDPYFMNWFEKYSRENYRAVAVMDLSNPRAPFIEGKEAMRFQPASKEAYFILKRIEGGAD